MNGTRRSQGLAWKTTTLTCILAIAGTLALASAGCTPATTPTAPSASVPTETPGITGEITYVAAAAGAGPLGSITVEGGEQPEGAISDKAVAAITDQTAVFFENGDPATPADLQVGQEVKVWFAGPVAESYPVQGTATAVQITGVAPK